MAMTRAQSNRAIRQEALREQLSSQGHVQHVIEIIDKLKQLDTGYDAIQVTRLRVAIDAHLKLANKYIPDLKATEMTGPDGGPLELIAYDLTDTELAQRLNHILNPEAKN